MKLVPCPDEFAFCQNKVITCGDMTSIKLLILLSYLREILIEVDVKKSQDFF